MALVVIEGCDGTGKTRLASELSHYMSDGAYTLHRGPLMRNPLVEYIDDLVKRYNPLTRDIICDRWHIGELVYGPLYRGESQLTPTMFRFIELFLESRGAVKLWMDTPYEMVRRNLAASGEDFLQESHQRLVVDWYAEVLGGDVSWAPVSWHRKVMPFAESIINTARLRSKLSIEILDKWPSYIGPVARKPALLVVGSEPVNKLGSGWPTSLVPWRGSRFSDMMTAFELLGFTTQIAYLDTKDIHQASRLVTDFLDGPFVMALDAVSYAYFTDREIPAIRMSYPPRDVPAIASLMKTLRERLS